MNYLIVGIIGLLIPQMVSSQQADSTIELTILRNAAPIFDNYRFPDIRDSNAAWSFYQTENGRLPTLCSDDFNGDGHTDIAFFLISKNANNKYGVFCLVSNNRDSFQLITLDESEGIPYSHGISVAPPGHYKTAAGKGYWAPSSNEPLVLDLKNPAIDFFQFESANSFFVWDPKNNNFNRIWMSD